MTPGRTARGNRGGSIRTAARPGPARRPAAARLLLCGALGATALLAGCSANRPEAPTLSAAARTAEATAPVDPRYHLRAGELSDEILQATIGIASISVGLRGSGEDDVAAYGRHGGHFDPAGRIRLNDTKPVAVWRTGTEAVDPAVVPAVVRRYPIVARRGEYARVVLDARGRRTAWLRRTADGSFPDGVRFIDFDDPGSFRYEQVDLFYLPGDGRRKLFVKADRRSAYRILARDPGSEEHLDADLVPLRRQGDFLEVAAVRGLDDPRTSIGWVELRDESGRLALWLEPAPDV